MPTSKLNNISLNNIVQSLTVPTFVIDAEHRVVSWNRACESLTGVKGSEIIGTKDAWRGFYPAPRPCLADVVVDHAYQQLHALYMVHGDSKFSQGLHAENWFDNINGQRRYLIFDAEPLYDEHGTLVGALENLEDITEIKEAELAQQRVMERLMLSDKVFTYTDQAILITDAKNRIIAVNQAFTRQTGYTQEDVLKKNPSILSSGRHNPDFYAQLWDTLLTTGHWEGEIWDRRKDGSVYPKWLNINAVLENNATAPSHFIAIFTDITERKRAEEHIQHIAFHDALTGLPNRLLFYDRLQQAILEAHRGASLIALLFIDLDRFKLINDTLGHQIGDLLLQEVASRLRECVRETDTVARLGGDEFVIVLPNIQNPDDASIVASKILHFLHRPIDLNGNRLFATPSIGIALFPEDGENVEVLMQSADTAMYHAKESGRNNYQFFTQSMNKAAQDRVALERQLRHALDQGELELHYQPKIALNPFRVVGCEALARWKHPQLGYIPPDKFIPVAEETGLILPLGEWIMSEVARQNRAWTDAGLKEMNIAINLSPSQFRDKSLAVKLCMLLDEAGLKPDRLEIEITESLLMESISHSRQCLEDFAKLGVSLAIDDFGTGYSSLAYLRNFSVNTLKIDKSFVHDITNDLNDAAIVRAVISLAHELGLTVVAEGVETPEQRDFLANAGCDIHQGYFFSKPLPSAQFQEYVLRNISSQPENMHLTS